MQKRLRSLFTGTVQGVGFRPSLYRLARHHNLSGFIKNTGQGVLMEIEGESYVIDLFYTELPNAYPPMSQVENVETQDISLKNDSAFAILKSTSDARPDALITPDIATCVACREELLNPLNRRYRYPFINCTDCGPRLTILKEVPYDRANTSMSCFPLCKKCLGEFKDPDNRRYHAEPNACPGCGPQLKLLDRDGNEVSTKDTISDIIEIISNGQIAAVKGLGGFHLCADACNSDAINKLRETKFREEKPFAVMVKDIMQAAELCEINEAEKELLLSPECPIVLLKKKKFSPIAKEIAQNMPCLGIMLPSTPIQHLLFESSFQALVMTSANKKDEPICTGNREAIKRLSDIADFFLTHNRDILVRNDDSITMVSSNKKIMLRRSRGYAPSPISLGKSYPDVLALGSYLKSTACIVTGKRAYLSPHIGDLETPEARDFLLESVNLIKSIAKTSPKTIACDMHPDYFSTALAKQIEPENFVQVQHHHAHIVSCMAENNISGTVVGIAMDGTGYGPDNTVWGGEFLIADERNFTRAGHLKNIIIPGGESSIRQIWRIALSLIKEIYPDSWKQIAKELNFCLSEEDLELFEATIEKRINCFITSSLGRLFDAVSCLTNMRNRVSFEGQAAMELEAIVEPGHNTELRYNIYSEKDSHILDLMPAIKDIIEMRINQREPKYMATAFHLTLVNAFTNMAERIREEENLNRVLLSGGCFQNRILLEGCVNRMEEKGFEVIIHSLVPANDGGISLGQAVCAAARLQ